jgi:hypothetical protein
VTARERGYRAPAKARCQRGESPRSADTLVGRVVERNCVTESEVGSIGIRRCRPHDKKLDSALYWGESAVKGRSLTRQPGGTKRHAEQGNSGINKAMSSDMGWLEAEGAEGSAQEAGRPRGGGDPAGSQSRHSSDEVP